MSPSVALKCHSCESRNPKIVSRNPCGFDTDKFLGGDSDGVTPVPIPNTEVKPVYVDGTTWVTAWESRKLPGLNQTPNHESGWGFYNTMGNQESVATMYAIK